jgi:hypothetical protein
MDIWVFGSDMVDSKNLKEINMDSAIFTMHYYYYYFMIQEKISDLTGFQL